MIPGLPIPSGGEIKLALACGLGAGLIALGGGAAWEIQANRYEAKLAKSDKAHADAMKAVSDAAEAAAAEHLRRLTAQQQEIAALDERHTKEIADAKLENERLRAAVDDGSVQLRIRAACPAGGGGVPGAPAASRVDDAGTAVLDPAARSDYHALRRNLTDTEGKLSALQDYVRAILAKPGQATLPVPNK